MKLKILIQLKTVSLTITKRLCEPFILLSLKLK